MTRPIGVLTLAALLEWGLHAPADAMMPDLPAQTAHGSADPQPAWRLTMSSARYSGPLTLSELWDNELDQLQTNGGPRLIYLRDEAQASVKWGAVWLSVLARQSATLVASSEAAKVVKDIASRGKPGESYAAEVHMNFKGFAGAGLALDTAGTWRAAPSLQWRAGVQGLQLKRLLHRELSGSMRYDAPSESYAFDAQSTQFNDRHDAPFQAPHATSGWAILFNAGLTWQPTASLRLDLHARDLGRLWWAALPAQTMRLSSSTSTLDEQGYLVYEPLLIGNNRQVAYREPAVSTWQTTATWQPASNWQTTVALQRIDGFRRWLPYTGLTWRHSAWSWEAGRSWYEKAMHLRLTSPHWQIQFSTDRFDASARARALALSWRSGW